MVSFKANLDKNLKNNATFKATFLKKLKIYSNLAKS